MAMMGKAAALPPVKNQGATAMTIHRLLHDTAFGPEEISVMVAAFEDALRELGLANRADPATEIVAMRIIELDCPGHV
jgi:hypothetical protein